MAAQVGALRVTVGADINPLKTGMRAAERQVARSASVMERSVKSVNSTLAGLGTVAGVSLGAAGLLAGASSFLRVADAAKSLQAQLKLATAEFGSFERANKDVRAIAEQTRSGLLETADLYAALQRNSGQLGATQEQVARATRTVSEAFKVSGAATSEQAAATRQLIQAFQSGVLRGDEFNSIMENAPRLAKLLADSLGVTTGALRKMAEEGELTSDKLVRALTDKKFTEGLDAEFRQLPITFDEAMGQVYNSAIIVLSEFDRGGQFSSSIASFVSDGNEGFKSLGESAFQFGRNVADTLTAIEVVRDALGSMQSEGILGFGSLIDSTYGWRDALNDTLIGIDRVANAAANLFNLPGNAIRTAFPSLGLDPIINPVNLAGDFRNRTNKKDVEAARQRIFGRSANDVFAEVGLQRNPPPFRPSASGKKTKSGRAAKPPRDRSEDVAFQFDQELRQAQADVLRAQQSLATTSDERARIALLLLDNERATQEAQLNDRVRRAERDFAEGKITEGTLAQVKAQAEKLKAEYDSKDALERRAIAEDLAAEKARDVASLKDTDYDIQLELLQGQSALVETTAAKRDIELRILELMKQQERARLEAVIADKDSSELAKEEARRRLAALEGIYANREAQVNQQNRGALGDFRAQFGDIGDELEQLKVQGIMGAADALTQLTEGWGSFREAALSAIKQVIAELIRLQLLKLATSFLGGGVSPGAASSASSFGATSLLGGQTILPAFSTGGSFRVFGEQGFDKNTLSLNGIPIANVSYGEEVSVSNDNGAMGAASNRPVNLTQNFHGPVTRQTAMQAGAEARRGISMANRKGA